MQARTTLPNDTPACTVPGSRGGGATASSSPAAAPLLPASLAQLTRPPAAATTLWPKARGEHHAVLGQLGACQAEVGHLELMPPTALLLLPPIVAPVEAPVVERESVPSTAERE